MSECKRCGALLDEVGAEMLCDRCLEDLDAEEAGDRAYSEYNEERD